MSKPSPEEVKQKNPADLELLNEVEISVMEIYVQL